jgi:murein DD-endopeptidase MepM/ murein hydrolase activator NlpD
MDEVKSVDNQLRQLLKYQTESTQKNGKSANAAPAAGSQASAKGEGGPTSADMGDLARELARTDTDVSWSKMVEQVTLMKLEARDRVSSFDNLTQWIDAQKKVLRATPRGWPCSGHLTSHFGRRLDPFQHVFQEVHLGLDIANGAGTPIRATADGVVRVASWKNGYGNVVVLEHDCGFETRYAHNSRLLVHVGERVKRGQVLSLMGATGRASGPHCHYEVWRYNQRKNPIAFLPETPAGATGILTKDLDAPVKVASK